VLSYYTYAKFNLKFFKRSKILLDNLELF